MQPIVNRQRNNDIHQINVYLFRKIRQNKIPAKCNRALCNDRGL